MGGADSSPGDGTLGEIFLDPTSTGDEGLPLIARPYKVQKLSEPLAPETESYLDDLRDGGDWDREASVLRWLVSGDPDIANDPRTELAEDSRAPLVGQRAIGGREISPVWAPRVSIPGGKGGFGNGQANQPAPLSLVQTSKAYFKAEAHTASYRLGGQ